MKKFLLTITVALTTLAAAHAERLYSDYMGNGISAYFNSRGDARGYTVNNPTGLYHYNKYGQYIGRSVFRGRYLYMYDANGWLLGRTAR
jgi:hypothetical protein